MTDSHNYFIFQSSNMTKLQEIYCINLRESSERRERMNALFDSMNFSQPIYHFDAIKGSLVTGMDLKLSKGLTGCLLSQMHLWFMISQKKGNDFYLILEDDLILGENVDSSTFSSDFGEMVATTPKSIGIIHCSRDINKMFVKNKRISKYKPKFKVINHFQTKQMKKCSIRNPWSTETGAILIRPKYARKLFKYAKWVIKYNKHLPFSAAPDMIIAHWPTAYYRGAMIKIFQQNVGVSDISSINKEEETQSQRIRYNMGLFEKGKERLTLWDDKIH